MKSNFDPAEYVRQVGCELVRAFESAREATTPGLVGSSIEKAVRDKIEQMLPRGIGVGSGCVIDTRNNTSRQLDIILYEKDQCPKFAINDNSEANYFPVEAVLAVGEIKSVIGKKELSDGFKKIASVKKLYRSFEKTNDDLYVGRRYNESGSTTPYAFHQENTNLGDVFGFILAEKSSVAITLPIPSKTHKSAPKSVLLKHYADNVKALNNDVLCPDITVFLEGTLLIPETLYASVPYMPTRAKNVLPHAIVPAKASSPFGELIKMIWKRQKEGLTAHIPLERYLQFDSIKEPKMSFAKIVNHNLPEKNHLKIDQKLKIVTPTDHLKNDLIQLVKRKL